MRLLISAMLVAIAAQANAQGTNTLDTYKQSHERQQLANQVQYGKALDALATAVMKEGDLDAVLILQAEQKRFRAEGTVPDPTDAKDSFRPASEAYYRAIVTLLERYVTALEALIKTEVTAGRIEEAISARTEKDRAAFILADMQTKLPVKAPVPTPQSDPPDKMRPTTAERLAVAIDRGVTFQVTFDRIADPIGGIKPGAVLTGFYTKSRQAWEVWSPSHPNQPNTHFVYTPNGDDGTGRIGATVQPEDGKINLWGPTFPFNDKGTVFHPSNRRQAVGRLELLP